MKNKLILGVKISIITFIFSCGSVDEQKKKDVVYDEIKEVGSHVNPQVFSVNTNSDTILYGLNGTQIELKFSKSNLPTQELRVELKEFYKISDMLLNNLSTESDTAILETGGMAYLTIQDRNGKTINLEDTPCVLKMPGQKEEEMTLFYGSKIGNKILWKEDMITMPASDDTLFMNAYRNSKYFDIYNLGWINCDRFIEIKEKTDLIVNCDSEMNNISVFVVFSSSNSILMKYTEGSSDITFKGLPKNETVTIISISRKGKNVCYSLSEKTIDGNSFDLPELTETTEDNLKKILDKKFKPII